MSVLRITLQVQPNSKRPGLEKTPDGKWKLKISAKPVDGAANVAVIEFLSHFFDLNKSSIRIFKGEKSKHKVIEFESQNLDSIREYFESATS